MTEKSILIRARGLAKTFRPAVIETPVLRGISIVIRSGELALLMGPSGSGKTTLLCVLSGLLRPSVGEVDAVSRLELQPVLLVQLDNSVNDGLKRELERQDLGASKNMSYAFEWFFLAITVLILLLALNVKRSSPQQ